MRRVMLLLAATLAMVTGCRSLFEPADGSAPRFEATLFICTYAEVACEGRRDLEILPDGRFVLWQDTLATGLRELHGTWKPAERVDPGNRVCVDLVYPEGVSALSLTVDLVSDEEVPDECIMDPDACVAVHPLPVRLCVRGESYELDLDGAFVAAERRVLEDRVPRPSVSRMRR